MISLELFIPFTVGASCVQIDSYPFGNSGKQAYDRKGLNAAINAAKKRYTEISERYVDRPSGSGERVLIVEGRRIPGYFDRDVGELPIAEICRFKVIEINDIDVEAK